VEVVNKESFNFDMEKLLSLKKNLEDIISFSCELIFKVWGAGGAGGEHKNSNHGGAGGFISGRYMISSGEKLIITVGLGGQICTEQNNRGILSGNGGKGNYNYCSGSGGGSSHIISSIDGKVIIGAGGGGGGSGGQSHASGGGGGGGTKDGLVGKGGDAGYSGGGNYKGLISGKLSGTNATNGGGMSGESSYGFSSEEKNVSATPNGSHGNNQNGAGGRTGNGESGGGGEGGACSISKSLQDVKIINAIDLRSVGENDENFQNSAGKGGEHGGVSGNNGRVVIITGSGQVFEFSSDGTLDNSDGKIF
jgi:hypothetical protein